MAGGPHAELVSPYFQHMRLLLMEGIVLGDIDVTKFRKVTAKNLYLEYTNSFPPPKVVYKYDVDWALVWGRLNSPVLDPSAREQLFMIINNIVANRERLFMKMNMVNSPNCLRCNVREDNTHLFMECVMVQEAWGWLRARLPDVWAITSDFEFLNLMFKKAADWTLRLCGYLVDIWILSGQGK